MAGLVFTIEAQDKFSPTFQKAQSEIQKAGNVASKTSEETKKLNFSVQDLQGGISGIIGKFSSLAPIIGTAVLAIGAMSKAVKECVKEFAQAEVVNVRFEQSLKSLNLSVYTNQFSNLATQMQRLTGTSDEVVKDAIQVGLQMGISADNIERTIKVAADLAATFGIDLRTAVQMLAKAQEGETMQLVRLLPNMKEIVKEGASYAEILGAIESRVKGAAEAQGNTLIGSMNRLKETFNDLKETIGGAFAQSLANLYNWLTKIIEKINENAKVSLGVAGYEIDKQIKDLQTQKEALKVSYAAMTPEQQAFLNKQLEAIDNQIAILKQQKVANELQIKILQEQEKKTKEAATTTSTTTTTAEKQVQQLTTFVNTSFTSIFKNFLEDLEFNFDQFTQATQEIIQKYKTRNKKESTVEDVEAAATGADELAESFDYLGIASQALGVNLQAGVQGFLISILQQTQAFAMLGQVFTPLITMLDTMLVPLLNMLLPPIMAILNAMKPIFDVLIVPLLTFGAIISNLIAGITAFATLIMYIVTFQFNKIKDIKWTGTSIQQLGASIQGAWAGVEGINTTNLTNLTSTGTGASYSAAASYKINVYVYTSALVGEDGIDEFAMIIKQKIDMAVARGA